MSAVRESKLAISSNIAVFALATKSRIFSSDGSATEFLSSEATGDEEIVDCGNTGT